MADVFQIYEYQYLWPNSYGFLVKSLFKIKSKLPLLKFLPTFQQYYKYLIIKHSYISISYSFAEIPLNQSLTTQLRQVYAQIVLLIFL